ncbi:MAG: type II toxin-antitoxin system VapC family toxin [Nitrospirae bacterium]|nr:type II toxin-antitoxin system VapC family toxin [Nitrospirota bacterium]
MKALFDTHVFLWWVLDDARLTPFVRDLVADERNELFLSSASCWEMMIKARLGRLAFPEPPEKYIPDQMNQNKLTGLPVQIVHALHIHRLPEHHKDPFDRTLIAQAQVERMPIITNDSLFTAYDVKILWEKKGKRQ